MLYYTLYLLGDLVLQILLVLYSLGERGGDDIRKITPEYTGKQRYSAL